MRTVAFLTVALAGLLFAGLYGQTLTPRPSEAERVDTTAVTEEYVWVAVDRLNRRTCPSRDCGIVGRAFYRERFEVHERLEGWVRVSEPYDASCRNGQSEYVDDGNANCSEDNGIVDGQLSEWLFGEHLAVSQPDDPAEGATGDLELVAGSDDYRLYASSFAAAARQLIRAGRCTEADFRNTGGWIKSMEYRERPVYFTYCSNTQPYVNADTGRVWFQ